MLNQISWALIIDVFVGSWHFQKHFRENVDGQAITWTKFDAMTP